MRTEVPICRRCCFCLPLRYGLLTWGYISLLADFFLLITYGFECTFFSRRPDYYNAFDILRLVIGLVNTVIVFSLTFLLIIALHKKNVKWLKLYYKSIVVCVVVAVLVVVTGLVYDLCVHLKWYFFFWRYFICDIIISGLCLGIQLNIIALVRSEIMKLKNNTNYEFSNIAVEAEGSFYGVNVLSDKPNNYVPAIEEDNEPPIAKEKTVDDDNEHEIAGKSTEEKQTRETKGVMKKNAINSLKNNSPYYVRVKNISYDKVVNME